MTTSSSSPLVRRGHDERRRASYGDVWADELIDAHLPLAAAAHPRRVALVDGERQWTYAELDAEVDRWAAALQAHGVGHGEVVSWQLPNWAEAVVVHQAILRVGGVSNPIIPIYRHSEVGFILGQARSRILFVPETFRGFDHPAMIRDLSATLPDLETVVVLRASGTVPTPHVGLDEFLESAADGGAEPVPERSPDDIALLLYTSGTTSDPKGVLHTHNTLTYDNHSVVDFYGLTSEDVVFMPSPVTHITGVMYALQLPFMLGASVVLLDVWEPGAGLGLVERFGCTFMLAATPFLHGMVEHPARTAAMTRSLRVFACGGADVPPDLLRRASSELGCLVARVYGSSEIPTATSGNQLDSLDARAGTDGRPIGDTEVRVVDARGAEVPRGIQGELWVRAADMFVGYLDPALDAVAFTPDGWFVTGDLAVADEDGYIRITGREKDIIVRGGENISAKEVEDLLFEHPLVAEVAIVAMPDPVLVERVCAFVVPRDGACPALPELTSWLRERRIAVQKLPERLVLVPDLPRTASGKIQKFKLRDRLRCE